MDRRTYGWKKKVNYRGASLLKMEINILSSQEKNKKTGVKGLRMFQIISVRKTGSVGCAKVF